MKKYTGCYQVVIHSIRLPKNSTVGDVINDLKTKVVSTSLTSDKRIVLCLSVAFFFTHEIILHALNIPQTIVALSSLSYCCFLD